MSRAASAPPRDTLPQRPQTSQGGGRRRAAPASATPGGRSPAAATTATPTSVLTALATTVSGAESARDAYGAVDSAAESSLTAATAAAAAAAAAAREDACRAMMRTRWVRRRCRRRRA